MEEILLIDKPAGMSSFSVVAKVRGKLSEKLGLNEQGKKKKIKVGHTGTLDPFATGLLILLVGKATKKSNEFLKLDKWYEATICLGKTSTTGDIEGEVSDFPGVSKNCSIEISEIERVVKSFLGEIEQKVPQYSAVKINGQRAYKLAREGKRIEMPVRRVKIYAIEIMDYKWPELKICCHVSSGTYIRALGEDIGEKLGVGGYLTELRRTKIADYDVKNAVKLEEFLQM